MRKFLLALFLAALTLAGCGGDDGGSTDTASESGSGSDSASGGDTDFSGKGSGDFCDLARDYAKKFADAGDAENETELADDYKEFSTAIDELADEAPSEIEADVKVVQGAFAKLNQLLEKYDYDFSKITEEEAATIDLESPEIQASNNRIESYFETVCKIDSDEDGDTDGIIETDEPTPTDGEQAPDESVDDTTTDDTSTDDTTPGE